MRKKIPQGYRNGLSKSSKKYLAVLLFWARRGRKWERNINIKKHLMLDSRIEGIDGLIFPNGH